MLFKLDILGENDKVIKTYETSVIKMGLIEDLIEMNGKLAGKSPIEEFRAFKPILFGMFNGLTDEELRNVDFMAVLKTMRALMVAANEGFGVSEEESKN